MIDIDEYESVIYKLTVFLEDNEQYGDDWSKEKKGLNDLLAEVKRLRDLSIEAYEIPMNTGEEKCMVKYLLREMIK